MSLIIVGAGLDKLAVIRQLLSFGFKVVVLEGRNRLSGGLTAAMVFWEKPFGSVRMQ